MRAVLLSCVLLASLFAQPGLAKDAEPFPVAVRTLVSPCTDSGTCTLWLECTPSEKLGSDPTLRIALQVDVEDIVTIDHVWKGGGKVAAGDTVDLEIPLALPGQLALDAHELIAVRVGFVSGGDVRPPDVDDHLIDPDGYADLDAFELPRFGGAEGGARLNVVLEEGLALKKSDPPAAWKLLSQALRDAADDATKEKVRDALREVGQFPPAEQSEVELRVVAQRIRAEQTRVFRLEAGRMAARGNLHGALVLLEEVGGALALDADEAVIGALRDAERTVERMEDLQERILTERTADQEAAVEAAVEKHGRSEDLFDHAEELVEGKEYAVALALYRKLRRVDGVELYDRAQDRLDEVSEQYLADVPPEQARLVAEVREHPAWDRTKVSRSHEFLFIGPDRLVNGIPEDSRLEFDLAYVFLTDLFGRKPNPRGDRVTVYYKELWDFGGGVGGGKIIDIGRANPQPSRPTRVDNGLLYHELTHCIDDTNPITGGFREGLANLGAAYAMEALDQDSDALHSFEGNLSQFEEFYLNRDLPFWRIQNYGPSAGFFLSFVEEYAKLSKSQHDWSPLRRFFREYRDAPAADGREPQVARGLTYYLWRGFGPQVFDDMVRYRFPLQESDRRQLFEEFEAYDLESEDEFQNEFAERPNSPIPRDLIGRDLFSRSKKQDLAGCEKLRAELGVIFDWKVIGPFFAERADPGAHVFRPELFLDFKDKPQTLRSNRRDKTQVVWQDPWPSWRPTSSHKNVELQPSGWIRFDYEPYGDDNSAIYALTHVTVPADTTAVAHLRANDDVTLWVNDERVGSYRGRGLNGSSERWRGPFLDLPDGIRFDVTLKAGRNRVLVKIKNRFGTAGLSMALANADGSPLDFEADNQPPDPIGERAAVPEPRYWKRLVTLDHRSYRSKGKTVVGGFKTKNKEFYGTDTDKGVKWRQWTVRPGFPKDSPSNLLWVKDTVTKKLEDAVRIRAVFAGDRIPKVLFTVQGEGNDDGLSGWNLIVLPARNGKVSARLERYDRLVYESDPMELPEVEESRELTFTVWRNWALVEMDGVILLDRISIRPIEGATRVGIATWGSEPRFKEVEVLEGK